MTDRFKPPLNRQIVDEAAEWFVEMNEGEADSVTRQRFHAWLALSPEHVRAYLELLPFWEEGAELALGSRDPTALIELARLGTNVVSLSPSVVAQTAAEPRPSAASAHGRRARFASRAAAYATAASVLVVTAALLVWMQMFRGVYDAGIGEQRIIALDDGSQIELNARSRIKVRFDGRERSVDLIAGQALFRVAKDKTRPFVVHSGDASVRAVGTQFDVYRKKTGTIVTVVEGSVAVAPVKAPDAARKPSILTAGQQIIITPTAVPEPRLADIALATAWTQQRLAFSRASLADVAEEFNRYNKRQVVIADRSLQEFRISGNFPSADPAPLLTFLRVQPGIRVTESGDEIVIAVDSPRPRP